MTAPRRILLTTFGSPGDVHPYLALGRALAARGHRVTLATHAQYGADAAALGLGFRAVRPDFERELPGWPANAARYMEAIRGSERVARELCMPFVDQAYEDVRAAAGEADLLVSHPLTFWTPIVGEQLGLPWVSTALAPFSMFSTLDPSVWPAMPWMESLRAFAPGPQRALIALARGMSAPWVEPVARLRARHGLPRGGHPLFEGQHSPRLVLGLFSSAFAAPQPDWPAHSLATGFAFRDSPGDTPLPADLEAFLGAGDPPIVFTLGTSAVLDARDFYDVAAAATARLGRRAVLLVGRHTAWKPAAPLPAGTHVADYVPYAEIFPRAAAIVHQGGIGTTAEALRSGRPMLVMPFSHDQYDNAARVRRLGVGWIAARARWTIASAETALARLLADRDLAARAAALGARIAAESGAQNAADAIETLAESA